MVEGFLDDSGRHAGSRVLLLAGFAATREVWSQVELKWQALLDEFKDYGVTHFHAIDCRVGEGCFGRLEVPYRRRVFYGLADILAEAAVQPIWSGIDMEAWRSIGDAPVKHHFKDPLHLCFSEIVRKAMAWSRSEAEGAAIDLVVAEDSRNEPNIRRIFQAYRAQSEWGEFLRSLTFGRAKNVIPLQAADLIANSLYGDWMRTLHPQSIDDLLSIEEPLSRITAAHHLQLGGLYTVESLMNIT